MNGKDVFFSTEPDMVPCTESSVIEIVRNGTMEENSSLIVLLLMKKLDQVLWPNASAKTTSRGRRTESLRVANMAVLALSKLPAPNSFETLVLSESIICLRRKTFNIFSVAEGDEEENNIRYMWRLS